MLLTSLNHDSRLFQIYAVKRDIANLCSAFNFAIQKKFINHNFSAEIKKPKITEKLPLYFSGNEFEIVLSKINDVDLKELVLFTSLTGLRQSDLINLTRQQINFKERLLVLNNQKSQTKFRKVYSLPLSIKALSLLNDKFLRYGLTDRVFIYKGKPIKQ